MSKSIRNIWEEKFSFDKFVAAHERASLGKRFQKEILEFDMNLESNLSNLMRQIENGTYKTGKYREFVIYEPKKRIIKSLPYQDRVVHQ